MRTKQARVIEMCLEVMVRGLEGGRGSAGIRHEEREELTRR
jgi:hypothetical protein